MKRGKNMKVEVNRAVLLLAQLVEESKGALSGKFGLGITAQGKRQPWEITAWQINVVPSFYTQVMRVRSCNPTQERALQHQVLARDEGHHFDSGCWHHPLGYHPLMCSFTGPSEQPSQMQTWIPSSTAGKAAMATNACWLACIEWAPSEQIA